MCICIENLKSCLGNYIEADKFFLHSYSYSYEGKLPTQLCHLLLLYLQGEERDLPFKMLRSFQNFCPKENKHFSCCFSVCCKKKRESFKKSNCGLYLHCYFRILVSFFKFKLKYLTKITQPKFRNHMYYLLLS